MDKLKDLKIIKVNIWSIFANVRKSSFVKNVIVIMSGSVIAQVLGYALSPVISRLFSPADFGILGSFWAVLGVIAAGLTLEYSQAIMLPKQKEEAAGLLALSFMSTAIIGASCLLACILFPTSIQKAMKAPNAWILGLLILGILVSGLNQTCQAWCVRTKAFKHTSASQVIRSLSTNGTQVGLGYLKGGASALILTTVLGDLLASLNLARVAYRDLRTLSIDYRLNRLWKLAKEYRDFPLYAASVNVVDGLSAGLPIFLLTHFFGIAVAGAYAFGLRIISAPQGLILRALRQVLYQKACETHNNGGRLLPLYMKFTGGLFGLALIPTLVLLIWAPQLFAWIFGPRWHQAGTFARSLILWQLFMFCNLPAGVCARIARMLQKLFFLDIILLILRALVLIAGGLYLSASATVMAISLVGAVMNVIFIFMVGFALKKQEGETTWNDVLNNLREG